MAAPLPAADRIRHLRDVFGSIQPLLPSGCLISPEPFRLSPHIIDDLQRLGPVLSRFRRTADLIHRRSIRGSLPGWIAAMIDQGGSIEANDELPSIFRPSLKFTKKGLSLVDIGWQADQIALGGQLQQLHSQMGEAVIGGARGILDGADSVSGEENGDIQAVWAPLRPSSATSLWLALLWSAPLQSVWTRELRSSNLTFLRKFVPLAWAVDPTPLPHQAVLPWLGVRSFGDLAHAVPGISDLALKPASASLREQREVIRSRATPGAWAAALGQAMDHFGRSPWLLREFHEGETVEHPGWNSALESAQSVSGEVTLTPYYFERAGQTALGGILATIEPCMPIPLRSEGETGEILSVLAPCVADTPN